MKNEMTDGGVVAVNEGDINYFYVQKEIRLKQEAKNSVHIN